MWGYEYYEEYVHKYMRVMCDYKNMLMCSSYFIIYIHMLVLLVFAISTHLLVHTECSVFISVDYTPVMCAILMT